MLVYILTDQPHLPTILRLQQAYENNGYLVMVYNLDQLMKTHDVARLLIVDLDSLTIRDNEDFMELLATKATRILILCTTSFQRLLYYKDFETYTSVDNLLEREFFAY